MQQAQAGRQARGSEGKVNVTFQKDYQNLAVHRTTGIHLTLQEEVEPWARILLQRPQPEQKDEVASVHVDVDDRKVIVRKMKEVHQ